MKQERISSADNNAALTADLRDRLQNALRLLDSIPAGSSEVRRPFAVSEDQVRSIIRERRRRNSFFDASLFAEPAWDMLLELYATALGQRRIAVSSLCDAAAVPATTALRWITNLEKLGCVTRMPDPLDGRRFHVSLSAAALSAMNEYFASQPNRWVI